MPPKKKNVEEEVEYYEDEDTYMEEGLSLLSNFVLLTAFPAPALLSNIIMTRFQLF